MSEVKTWKIHIEPKSLNIIKVIKIYIKGVCMACNTFLKLIKQNFFRKLMPSNRRINVEALVSVALQENLQNTF